MKGKLLARKIIRRLVVKEKEKKVEHALGVLTWPTKSFESWVLLQNLLYIIQPGTTVELGAGRSTFYLGEYAFKKKKVYCTFEQHRYYLYKLKLGLSLSFLPSHFVKYAPISGDWYDTKVVEKHLAGIDHIDFLYCDGPATPSNGYRGSKSFYDIIYPKLQQVKFVLLDDVHRPLENTMADELKNNFGMVRYNFHSESDDTLFAVMFSAEINKKVRKMLPEYMLSRLNQA